MKNTKALDEIIQHFTSGRSFDADQVSMRCHIMSEAFMKLCRRFGYEAHLVHLMDSRLDFPNQHRDWDVYFAQAGDFYNHYIVEIGSMTYDFTYRQFDPESDVPRIIPFDDLIDEWDSVVVENILTGSSVMTTG